MSAAPRAEPEPLAVAATPPTTPVPTPVAPRILLRTTTPPAGGVGPQPHRDPPPHGDDDEQADHSQHIHRGYLRRFFAAVFRFAGFRLAGIDTVMSRDRGGLRLFGFAALTAFATRRAVTIASTAVRIMKMLPMVVKPNSTMMEIVVTSAAAAHPPAVLPFGSRHRSPSACELGAPGRAHRTWETAADLGEGRCLIVEERVSLPRTIETRR